MQPSGFLKLNWRDLLRGLIVAAGTVILTNAVGILNSGRLPTQAEIISMAIQGLSAIGTYLLMNFFTPGKQTDDITPPPPPPPPKP